jgi:hypothetical protein
VIGKATILDRSLRGEVSEASEVKVQMRQKCMKGLLIESLGRWSQIGCIFHGSRRKGTTLLRWSFRRRIVLDSWTCGTMAVLVELLQTYLMRDRIEYSLGFVGALQEEPKPVPEDREHIILTFDS